MRVTIETGSFQELEQILLLLKSLHIKSIEVIPGISAKLPVITKGDKSIDPTPLFGIWKHQPRRLEEIRVVDWKRDWNV